MKQTLKATMVALGLSVASIFLGSGSFVAHAEPGSAPVATVPMVKPVALMPQNHTQITKISDLDKRTIAVTVSSHVWALSNGVSGLVYEQVTPKLRQVFKDPQALMVFLAKTHPPVALARDYHLDGLIVVDNVPVQRIYVVDHKKRQWLMFYAMEKDANGTWTIASGHIIPAPGRLI